ncbi:MAG: lysophospholipid acyltransferase family protein [Ilumatobacteraceae bacterium]
MVQQAATDVERRSFAAALRSRLTPSDETLGRIVRGTIRPLYRVCTPVRVEGLENLPRTGPVIVAANHISFYDTVVLMLATHRQVSFIGKAEYLDSWKTRRLFPALGLIPIDRQQAKKAMSALDVAAGVLNNGHMLGIYPEGTRSRDGLLHRGHTGVAQLAMMTGAPVVPVGIVGTDRIQPIGARAPRPFRRGIVRFGTPIDPAHYGGAPRRRRQQLTLDLMDAIHHLSGQQASDDFASGEPPLIRGGNESVYQVHHLSAAAASWQQAARFAVGRVCLRHDDARVGEVRGLRCELEPDGSLRFAATMAISVKYRPFESNPQPPSTDQ